MFRKKPVVIEAVQWLGTNLLEVIRFTGQNASADHFKWEEYEDLVACEGLKIFTLEGAMLARSMTMLNCPGKHNNQQYFDRWDSWWCPDCGWRTPKCSDPKCSFCSTRPEDPTKP